MIRDLVGRGTTLLLTTQYLEEADQLADDILVIDHGLAIAHGTADQLKAQVGGERVEVTVASADDVEVAWQVLTQHAVGEIQVGKHGQQLTAPVAGGAQTLTQALRELDQAGVAVSDVGLRRPTLDDVFLSLTGHVAEHEEAPTDEESAGAPRQEVAR